MPPFVRLIIRGALLAEVVAHARRELPNEGCGLLAGRVADGAGVASASFPVGNDAASSSEYETNARDMLHAFRDMRERGLELLAIYHSHPMSEPVPSRPDLERNTYGESVAHVIVGLAAKEPQVRAWWLGEGGCREAPLEIAEF
jgi:proteasome lid subunit RPN8/RPN11